MGQQLECQLDRAFSAPTPPITTPHLKRLMFASSLAALARGATKVVQPIAKWKLLRGDTVQVVRGKDSGKVGEILAVKRSSSGVIVRGVNVVTKHVKPVGGQTGRIDKLEKPVHYSNVALVDPVTGDATKVSFRYLEDGTKVRVARKTGNIIPRPQKLLEKRFAPSTTPGPLDTPAADVLKPTH